MSEIRTEVTTEQIDNASRDFMSLIAEALTGKPIHELKTKES